MLVFGKHGTAFMLVFGTHGAAFMFVFGEHEQILCDFMSK